MLPIMLKAGNSWREAEIYRSAAHRAGCQPGLQHTREASWGRERGGYIKTLLAQPIKSSRMLIADCRFINETLHHPPEMKRSREEEEYGDNIFTVESGSHYIKKKKKKLKSQQTKHKKPEPKPTIFIRVDRLLLYEDPLKILLQGKLVKYSVAITMLNWKTFTIKSSKSSIEYFWSCKRLENVPNVMFDRFPLFSCVRVFIFTYISENQNPRIHRSNKILFEIISYYSDCNFHCPKPATMTGWTRFVIWPDNMIIWRLRWSSWKALIVWRQPILNEAVQKDVQITWAFHLEVEFIPAGH